MDCWPSSPFKINAKKNIIPKNTMQNNAMQNETVHKTICKIMQYKILQWTKLYNTQVNTIYIYIQKDTIQIASRKCYAVFYSNRSRKRGGTFCW